MMTWCNLCHVNKSGATREKKEKKKKEKMQTRSVFLVVVVVFVGYVYGVTLAEMAALQDLYSSLDGPGWLTNKNWNSGDPCENSWAGVTCTAETASGHVQAIDLQKNLLKGIFPSSISNLYAMSSLQLDQNAINGTIPSTMNDLRALTLLSMSSNSLSGSIPDGIGKLASDYSLDELFLQSNILSGLVPSSFSSESSDFKSINLSDNPFVCPIPAGAEYTQATCVNWNLSYTPSRCLSPFTDEAVYGAGFVPSLQGVQCSYSGFSSSNITTDAFVVNSNLLYCVEPIITFDGCTGNEGEELVVQGELSLMMNGGSISNSLPVSALNTACPWGSSSYPKYALVNGSISSFDTGYGYKTNLYVQIPTMVVALEACSAGVTKPFRCPASVKYPDSLLPVFDLTCGNDEGDSCTWAPVSTRTTYSGSAWLCPFYVTDTCYSSWASSSSTPGPYNTQPCISYTVQS